MASARHRPPSPPRSTGARIRAARKERGLSQTELAGAVGVTQPTVANWEHDAHTPRRAALPKLASALAVTPDWILKGAAAPRKLGPRPLGPRYLDRPIRHVPIFDAAEATGFDPGTAEPVDHFAASIDALTPFAMRVDDRSMSRVIPRGAMVIFDADGGGLLDGELHLVEHNGRAMVRRWGAAPPRLETAGDGAADEITFLPAPPRAIGRALMVISALD